jgi:nucleotide-binding universal stress UspA family protein
MYRQLLVPVDGSAAANAGLQEAIRLAGNSKAVIRLVHVIDRLSFLQSMQPVQIIEEILVQMERAGRDILASARSQVARARVPVEAVIRKPAKGSVADTLIKEAQRAKVDLIVMGTHHTQNPWRVILRDTASGVVRHCACPVLLVPPQSAQRRPTRPRLQTASSAGNAA